MNWLIHLKYVQFLNWLQTLLQNKLGNISAKSITGVLSEAEQSNISGALSCAIFVFVLQNDPITTTYLFDTVFWLDVFRDRVHNSYSQDWTAWSHPRGVLLTLHLKSIFHFLSRRYNLRIVFPYQQCTCLCKIIIHA